MIKLTTVQARAVACKIRERVNALRNEKKDKLKEQYRSTEEYKAKKREVHEACVSLWQASVKLNMHLGIRIASYTSYDMYRDTDVEYAEKGIMEKIENEYVNSIYSYRNLPSEETLTQDLIFESLLSEGIEELMNKFIENYL